MHELDRLKITVITDNYAGLGRHYFAEHGWACLIETPGHKILFDTGQTGTVLRHNLAQIRENLHGLDAVVLSHGHYDHTGGLGEVLALAPGVRVYGHPCIFDDKFVYRDNKYRPIGVPFNRDDLERDAEFVLSEGPAPIIPGIMTTGEIPRGREFETEAQAQEAAFLVRSEDEAGRFSYQPDYLLDDLALICTTTGGSVVISGCAHAGIVNTIDHALRLVASQRLRAVIGGTHLHSAPSTRINATLSALAEYPDAQYWFGHCTGLRPLTMAIARLSEQQVQPSYAGLVLEFGQGVKD